MFEFPLCSSGLGLWHCLCGGWGYCWGMGSVPGWCNMLRIRCCHPCGLGCSCISGLILGLGTSTCSRHAPSSKKIATYEIEKRMEEWRLHRTWAVDWGQQLNQRIFIFWHFLEDRHTLAAQMGAYVSVHALKRSNDNNIPSLAPIVN